MQGCLACSMVSGQTPPPGGDVVQGTDWVVQHAVGPVVPGTLALKTRRHCVAVGDLNTAEASELGPLLKRSCACVMQLTGADRVHVDVWSQGQWVPGHLHFVVRPGGPDGAHTAAHEPDAEALDAMAARARAYFAAG